MICNYMVFSCAVNMELVRQMPLFYSDNLPTAAGVKNTEQESLLNDEKMRI